MGQVARRKFGQASAPTTVTRLRARALAATFFAPTTLGRAFNTLGFVQADPIRAPARAQDLILRHRVADYAAGELERRFARLRLEEDFFYAHGFMPRATLRLLHPRYHPEQAHVPEGLAAEVLAAVRERGVTHPAELEEQFGRTREVNNWGGFSKATTRALHSLHHHGLLRIARRRDGIRMYEAVDLAGEPLPTDERARRLVLLLAGILAPASDVGLRGAIALMAHKAPGLRGSLRQAVAQLLQSGALESAEVDGEKYLWPTGAPRRQDDAPAVRFLSPFDPLVWDRRRFEHFWGWPYRFEAYTPPAKRRMGYYAMPLLWGDRIIGWANVSAADGGLTVATGFAGSAPKGRAFRAAFDQEVARMEAFLDHR